VGATERAELPGGHVGRRVLPNSQEAEESVVGGVLLYPKGFLQVADLVEPDDFYHPTLAAIFRAMIELDEGRSQSTRSPSASKCARRTASGVCAHSAVRRISPS
jgi:hypothetical protein